MIKPCTQDTKRNDLYHYAGGLFVTGSEPINSKKRHLHGTRRPNAMSVIKAIVGLHNFAKEQEGFYYRPEYVDCEQRTFMNVDDHISMKQPSGYVGALSRNQNIPNCAGSLSDLNSVSQRDCCCFRIAFSLLRRCFLLLIGGVLRLSCVAWVSFFFLQLSD
ncbi:hypothetical protein GQX74_003781 [Glossina fuscipes]|nr:hypothetical protein GQX74_003781 [Glossina fuscipes]